MDEQVMDMEARPNDLVLVSEVLPDHLLIIPLQDRPIFPGITLPVIFSGKPYVEAIRQAQEKQPAVLGVILVRSQNNDNIFESKLYNVGTTLRILKATPISADSVQVVVQGINRFNCKRVIVSNGETIKWEVKYNSDPDEKPSEELRAYSMALISSVRDVLAFNPIFQEQLKIY